MRTPVPLGFIIFSAELHVIYRLNRITKEIFLVPHYFYFKFGKIIIKLFSHLLSLFSKYVLSATVSYISLVEKYD